MSQGFTAINSPHRDMNAFQEEMLPVYAFPGHNMEEYGGAVNTHEIQLSDPPMPTSAVQNITKKRSPQLTQANEATTPAPKTPRKNSKAKANNEDGTPVPKTTSARKKAAPKVDENGNPIPKTPRKKAEPKPKVVADGEPIPKAPRKTPAKKVKSPSKIEDEEVGVMNMVGELATASVSGCENGYSAGDGANNGEIALANGGTGFGDSTNPTTATKRPTTPKGKKTSSMARVNGSPSGTPSTPAGKKKRSAKASTDEDGENDAFTTPSKKAKVTGTPKSSNGKGMAIASSRDQLSAEDKMVLQMREEKKSWPEIRKMWEEMTGKVVGGSTLPNRYGRIMANLTDWKEGDIERMLYARDQVSKSIADEIEVHRKKLEGELYTRMSAMMVELGAETYNAAAIEKAYIKERREGFPHQGTIEQVLSGNRAAAVDNDADMLGVETPEEGNSDGGVPISPKHIGDANETDQDGFNLSVEAVAEIDAEMDEA